MSAIVKPKLGFRASVAASGDRVDERLSNTAREAARRKFTPEFINRLDRIVVFKTLGESELRRVLNLELQFVEDRLSRSLSQKLLALRIAEEAKDCLLREGIDERYGARHLKRALERLLLQPMSNLIATGQIQGGDAVFVDCAEAGNELVFFKESRNIPDRKRAAHAGGPVAA